MKVQASTELSRLHSLQRLTTETRSALDRASKEMSTGEKASKYAATGGNLNRLYGLERMLERVSVHEHNIGMTETKLEFMQLGVQRAQVSAGSIAVDMLAATGLNDPASARQHAEASRRAFFELVSTLNAGVAGESLYAGTATDGAATLSGEAILEQIKGLVDALVPLDAVQAVDVITQYFDGTGAGTFAAEGYVGSDADIAPVEVGDGTRITFGIRATDPRILEALKGHALAAVTVGDGTFANASDVEKMVLWNASGKTLLNAREGLLDLGSQIGSDQEAVENARAQRNAERETFDLARAKILAADPYDSATMFEAMRAQLESTFTVTARIGTLRFVNFLR